MDLGKLEYDSSSDVFMDYKLGQSMLLLGMGVTKTNL